MKSRKPFSDERYYVVGLVGAGCRKYSESRFQTFKGARNQALRLLGETLPLREDQEIFIDIVRKVNPNTLSREEQGTNRLPSILVDVMGRVWTWDGVARWSHSSMLK